MRRGLTTSRKRTAPEVQQDWFRRHLDLAAELHLPVIVHNRDADADVAPILLDWARESGGSGLLHCFSGDNAMLNAGLEARVHRFLRQPRWRLQENAGALPDRASRVPLDRIVVETDCPYLPPHPHRGKRNEPAHVRLTAARIAELHGLPIERIERATTDNAQRVFPALAAVLRERGSE